MRVSPWSPRKESDQKASDKGKSILSKPESVFVKYNRKKWCLGRLVQYLADRVAELEKNQCKPHIRCLFEGQKYLDDKFIKGKPDDE